MVYVTRKAHFNAAHRIYNPAWDDAKNNAVFGKCNNPRWHGHNYELEITLCGRPDPDTGYVYDLGKLAELIDAEIVEPMDHKNLNLEVDFLQDVIPTSENLAVAIWRRLEPHITAPARLHCVRLYETPRNFVEYRGE